MSKSRKHEQHKIDQRLRSYLKQPHRPKGIKCPWAGRACVLGGDKKGKNLEKKKASTEFTDIRMKAVHEGIHNEKNSFAK